MKRLLQQIFCTPSSFAKAAADRRNDVLRNKKGFTLIEMVIVVVVLSTVALIVYPRIAGAVDSLRISAAAQRLGNDIRYVRDLALSDHGTYGITFFISEHVIARRAKNSLKQSPHIYASFHSTISKPPAGPPPLR